MKNLNYKIIAFALLILTLNACTQKTKKGVAIVIDKENYEKVQTEIEAYKNVLEEEGLTTYLLVKNYPKPDSLKNDLLALYNSKNPIEGAVFIGKVPIAMISDAQHLTTAFKMNQKHFGLETASVPSDRFYDDFDLKFDYIKQDTAQPMRHYYSLRYDSPQKLSCDIYTGRIKVPKGENQPEALKKYLQKIVKLHKEKNQVNNILFFAGHGYISESFAARMDEKICLLQQFGNHVNVSFLDHNTEEFIKFEFMQDMERNNLDIAICHHHGSKNTQYLSGWIATSTHEKQIEQAKRYFRSMLKRLEKRGKDTEKYKKEMMKKYAVQKIWFNEQKKEDSLYNAKLILSIPDFENYKPNARFVLLDACYNGAFQNDEYIAGKYIFSEGNTAVVQANSVNVLQDKWTNRLLGLTALGRRVGEWNKKTCFLETHIIGDPTFQFTANNTFSVETNNAKLQALLKNKNPDIQAFALHSLAENNYKKLSNLLLETYKNSENYSVRAECLDLASKINDDNYLKLLKLALFDSYELLQRFAIKQSGNSGNEQLISQIVKLAFTNMSERVEFNYINTLAFFDKEKLKNEFQKQYEEDSIYFLTNENKNKIIEVFEKSDRLFHYTLKKIKDSTANVKQKLSAIRTLRNYNFHTAVNDFFYFLDTNKNEELQVAMLEALGWFTLSYKKEEIIDYCKKIEQNEQNSEAIKQEAHRTILRLDN